MFVRWFFKMVSLCLMVQVMAGAGCSGKSGELSRASIQGTVTLDGNPFPEGVIRFVPEAPTEGPAASAGIVDGKFRLPADSGPVVGTHRVEVTESPDPVPDPDDAAAVAKYLEAQKKKPRNARGQSHGVFSKNDLSATVSESGPNEFHFELTSRAK